MCSSDLDYIKKDKKKTDNENVNLVLSQNNCAEIKSYSFNEIEKIFNQKIEELKKVEIKSN